MKTARIDRLVGYARAMGLTVVPDANLSAFLPNAADAPARQWQREVGLPDDIDMAHLQGGYFPSDRTIRLQFPAHTPEYIRVATIAHEIGHDIDRMTLGDEYIPPRKLRALPKPTSTILIYESEVRASLYALFVLREMGIRVTAGMRALLNFSTTSYGWGEARYVGDFRNDYV